MWEVGGKEKDMVCEEMLWDSQFFMPDIINGEDSIKTQLTTKI